MPTENTNAHLSGDLVKDLSSMKWTHTNLVDLHKKGVHWFDPDFLPTWIPALTYTAYSRAGLTPPVALPTYFPDDISETITKWLDENHYRLKMGGRNYLGNEFNIQPAEMFNTAKCRICIVRLSDYPTVDGAFGHYLIGNFVSDFSDDIFVDYAFMPMNDDVNKLMAAGLPMMFSNTAKRGLYEFDILIISNSFPQERITWPLMSIKSGIPLHKWERLDESLPYSKRCPIIVGAGLGATFIENFCADNPRHGLGEDGMIDCALIGEGELLDLKIAQQYIYSVVEGGMSKREFLESLDNEKFSGYYYPSRVLWEYGDKVHTKRNYKGEVIGEEKFEGGGGIVSCSIVDEKEKTLHVVAGVGSDEFAMMEESNVTFIRNKEAGVDLTKLGESYQDPKKIAEFAKNSVLELKMAEQQAWDEAEKVGTAQPSKPTTFIPIRNI